MTVVGAGMPSARFEELRRRHAADRDAALPGYMDQLGWSAGQIRAERERRMRLLLATAKERSPWHRERLRHVEAEAFTEDDLRSLPTMSKDDLMSNFEAVVTDLRLTRDVVDSYVEHLPENLYLFDRYVVVASGGSSGRRGVFVYDWDAFVTFNCQLVRWRLRNAWPTLLPWGNLWLPTARQVLEDTHIELSLKTRAFIEEVVWAVPAYAGFAQARRARGGGDAPRDRDDRVSRPGTISR